MAKLSIWLPPFAPDYSGVSATIFDLKTVSAMHDASGCTGNYTGYDDPRWYGSASGIFCSGLRRIDAIMGDDEKLMRKMEAAARDIGPDILALIGSPVPMVVGADLKGIAAELEYRTGIPSFGFNTTGTAYYDKGAFMAAKALLKRFAEEPAAEALRENTQAAAMSPAAEEADPENASLAAADRGNAPSGAADPGNASSASKEPLAVNILGALPMDFGKGEDIGNLREVLRENGIGVIMCMAMDYTLDDIRRSPGAKVNLAVSRTGYLIAKYMLEHYRIPYVCGFPAGREGLKSWLAAIRRAAANGNPEILNTAPYDNAPSGRILIIGEQVMSNSVRLALREEGLTAADVGCIYGAEKELVLQGDMDLSDEKQIRAAVNRPEYDIIIADPFMKVLLPSDTDKRFLPLPQYAVSSKIGAVNAVCLAGECFHRWYRTYGMAG